MIPETINDRGTFNPFSSAGGALSGGVNQPSIYLDNYAKHQASTMKTGATSNVGGSSEVERLMREREELIRSGAYTNDDPLIQELDRQIRANHLRYAA